MYITAPHCCFQYNLQFGFNTRVGDRIGWTFDSTEGSISVSYAETHQTLVRQDEDTPDLGSTYIFDDSLEPSIFSIAVSVQPGI